MSKLTTESIRLLKYLDELLAFNHTFDSGIGKKKIKGVSGTMYSVLLNTMAEEVKKAESEWIKELKPKLSTPLPYKYKYKKRPQGRMFPFRIPKSNDLVNSLSTDFVSNYTNGTIDIKAWAEINSLHALLTNYGFSRAGKGTSKGKWAENNWMEKVFYSDKPYGNSKYGYVTSFSTIVHNIFRSKRLYNRIYYLKKKLRGELNFE